MTVGSAGESNRQQHDAVWVSERAVWVCLGSRPTWPCNHQNSMLWMKLTHSHMDDMHTTPHEHQLGRLIDGKPWE